MRLTKMFVQQAILYHLPPDSIGHQLKSTKRPAMGKINWMCWSATCD